MKLQYYPGCTLSSTAQEYDSSVKAVFKTFGIQLEEIKNWNCCGAVEATSVSPLLSIALPARNLTLLSESNDGKIMMPCTACLSNHIKAMWELEEKENIKKEIENIVGEKIPKVEIKHPLDVLLNEIGIEKIKEKVKTPLNKLKVAPYYGCVIVRPSQVMHFDDPEDPKSMDKILSALEAEVVPYPHKTECCGGALMMTNENLTLEMSKKIFLGAKVAGADCIAVICPMCHMALESLYEKIMEKFKLDLDIPVLYFTQLMGVAFSLDINKLGLHRNFISPIKLIKEKI